MKNGAGYRLFWAAVLIVVVALVCWQLPTIETLPANYYDGLCVMCTGVVVMCLLGIILPGWLAEPMQCLTAILFGLCATTTVLGVTF